jgi:translation initiation factor 3 subunit H
MSGRWGGSERDREKHRETERQRALERTVARDADRDARHGGAAAVSSSTSASTAAAARPLVVQLDGLVLLKMMSHSREAMPDVVSGQLLGLDVGQKLEVTNCFPFPAGLNEADSDAYQLEMMRHLRAVNVDNNTVGWYQSAYLGTFFDQGLLEAQYTYQKHIPASVVVVYDPFQTTKGRLVLKAYRLSDEFMAVYSPSGAGSALVAEGGRPKFSYEEFNKLGLDSCDIFQQVPIKVHNSHLVHGFLYELREEKQSARSLVDVDRHWSANLERVNVNYSAFLEKNLTMLGNTIEQYSQEQGKFQFFLRALARQKQQQADHLKKRQVDNESRAAAGKEPLPEEDLSRNPLFKPLAKPNRLDTYLLSNQIAYYADSIAAVGSQTFQKLYLVDALQKKQQDQAAIDAAASAL